MNTHFKLGELFSGPGGLGLGASWASAAVSGTDITHAWATDYDDDTCRSYAENVLMATEPGDAGVWHGQPHPSHSPRTYCADIGKLHTELLPDIDALAFGAPCNDFSSAGKRKGIAGRFGGLYSYGVSILRFHRPSWFLFENVGGLRSNGLDTVMRDFERVGYRLYPHYYRFEQYGVPQTRHRLIIIGIRSDLDVEFRVPAPFEADVSSVTALADIPGWAAHNEMPRMGKTSIERLEHIKPGQNAWNADLPEHLRITNNTQMSIFWRRLHPEKPSPTITASGGGGTHGYHYDEPRALTNRERARIQTFPDDFVFTGRKESVRRQIGMAVPPRGARGIFEAVLKSFTGEDYDWVESNMPRTVR